MIAVECYQAAVAHVPAESVRPEYPSWLPGLQFVPT